MDNKEKTQKKHKINFLIGMGFRRNVTICCWVLFIGAFLFAVYKNFTAIDTHTVHETTVIEHQLVDTNKIENFVSGFVKVYYSWDNTQESIDRRNEKLESYLTDELINLNSDSVRSDIPNNSSVSSVQIWDISMQDDNNYYVIYKVVQNIVNGEESSSVDSIYLVNVYVDDSGSMVITKNPIFYSLPEKADYSPKTKQSDGEVTADDVTEIKEFLATFFKSYPSLTEKELVYYVKNDSLPSIEAENYVYSELINPICFVEDDDIHCDVTVKYLDKSTNMTMYLQYDLTLENDDNWYIIGLD